MSESTRPPMEMVRKSLFMGGLIGLILGAILGILMASVYVSQNPLVYEGGAYPSELTDAYQKHYLAMVVDSYIVNQDSKVATERLKTFDTRTQILVLGDRSAAYVAAGRGVEAQAINKLALELKDAAGWDEEIIKDVVRELTGKYQDDPARAQAVGTFSAQMLNGLVPQPGDTQQQPPAGEAPAVQPAPPAVPPAASSGYSWITYLLCCLLFLVLLLIVYIIGKRRFEARRLPTRQVIEWEGEGPPPLKIWTGTYTLGQDLYDEFATIETDADDFLGEFGMGILESIPGTSNPKQVVAFDVGLFDKTDITTLSKALMSEYAYNDEAIRSKIEANPQAEAILAEPGKEFSFETSALRVDASIDEVEYAEGGNTYFEKLTVSLKLFLKEGADIRKGEMDIPDQYKA